MGNCLWYYNAVIDHRRGIWTRWPVWVRVSQLTGGGAPGISPIVLATPWRRGYPTWTPCLGLNVVDRCLKPPRYKSESPAGMPPEVKKGGRALIDGLCIQAARWDTIKVSESALGFTKYPPIREGSGPRNAKVMAKDELARNRSRPAPIAVRRRGRGHGVGRRYEMRKRSGNMSDDASMGKHQITTSRISENEKLLAAFARWGHTLAPTHAIPNLATTTRFHICHSLSSR